MQKLFCGTIFCHNIKDFYNEFLRLDVTFERFLGFDPDVCQNCYYIKKRTDEFFKSFKRYQA